MSTKRKDNIVAARKTVPKIVNIPDRRRSILRYKRANRNELLANAKIIKPYKQRAAPKNKRRRIRGRGLGNFIKTYMKNSTVRTLRTALKELPNVHDKALKKVKNKKLKIKNLYININIKRPFICKRQIMSGRTNHTIVNFFDKEENEDI